MKNTRAALQGAIILVLFFISHPLHVVALQSGYRTDVVRRDIFPPYAKRASSPDDSSSSDDSSCSDDPDDSDDVEDEESSGDEDASTADGTAGIGVEFETDDVKIEPVIGCLLLILPGQKTESLLLNTGSTARRSRLVTIKCSLQLGLSRPTLPTGIHGNPNRLPSTKALVLGEFRSPRSNTAVGPLSWNFNRR